MSPAPSQRRPHGAPAAVLWDMDGTIVDTEPYWIATEYELVAEFGGEWSDEKAHSIVGLDLRDSAAVLRDRGGVDLPIDDIVNRLLDGVIARVRRKVPWRPGARELLAALNDAGVPCALVTMSWRRFAEAVVSALPPHSFDAVITGDEVSHGKPHPEPYLLAARTLGVPAKACVAIEDSPTGVRSAVAAGCRVYAVPNVVDVPAGEGFTRLESLVQLDLERLGIASGRTAAPQRRKRRRRNWLPVLAAAVVLGLAAAGALALRRDGTPPPLPNIPVSGWAPYWVLPEATATVKAHGSLLTDVSPFWYQATGAATIALAPNVTAELRDPFLAAARDKGIGVLPSITDAMPKGGMAQVLASPATRTQHVQAIVSLVRQGSFEGIDLDYETFAFGDSSSTWTATRPNWVSFVDELAAALHQQGKLLSVTVPPINDTERTPTSGAWVYDQAAIGKVVDRVRVMAYDYSTSEPGPIGPLAWTRDVLRATKKAVGDDRKIVLGVPLYGRNWVVSTSGTCPSDASGKVDVQQRDIDALLQKRGGTPVHDAATGESTFEYDLQVTNGAQTCTQHREVHWVDEQGVRARVDLARAERIGGVAFWALGFDSDGSWAAVTAVARPRTGDTGVPAGSTPATGS